MTRLKEDQAIKNFIYILLLLSSSSAFAAGNKAGLFFGGMVGQQSGTWGGTVSPLSYGGTLGLKGKTYGIAASYITGAEDSTSGGTSVTKEITQILGRFDWYVDRRGIFFIGPALSHTSMTVESKKANGTTTSKTSSGLLYGGGIGLNIPLSRASTMGFDVSYVLGTIAEGSANVLSAMVTFKLWL